MFSIFFNFCSNFFFEYFLICFQNFLKSVLNILKFIKNFLIFRKFFSKFTNLFSIAPSLPPHGRKSGYGPASAYGRDSRNHLKLTQLANAESKCISILVSCCSVFTVRPLWSSGKTLAANAGGRGFESYREHNLLFTFYSI